jgi:hypothetical protein
MDSPLTVSNVWHFFTGSSGGQGGSHERTQLSPEDVVRSILGGTKQIVSHPGTGQYSQAANTGFSACGLAALNCTSTLLSKVSGATEPDVFLQELIARETLEVRCFLIDSGRARSLSNNRRSLSAGDLRDLQPLDKQIAS